MTRKKFGSVLVVDDDPSVLESSALLLREFGYDVLTASNAEDALEKFRADHIDTVITDIVMPAGSGIDLLRQVHDVNPSTPVILMTAYADMEKVIGAIQTGAFDFIIKPFTADLLVHSVDKAVRYNRLVLMERDYKHLLEEYNQEIESLISERTMSLIALTLADRIRNPASVIGLTCKRMLEKEKVPEHLQPKLAGILQETEKLDSIVQEFQSLFRTKKSMFRYEDVNNVVESVLPIMKKMIAGRGIDIVFNPSEQSLKVNIRRNLFKIALSHLIKNAAEATAEGGRITIATYKSGDRTVVEVSDTGYGISSDDVGKIFEPVFSSKDRHFGMGLPLVKRIISEHMGEIDVTSEPGKGTVFRISLPERWIQKT